MKKEDFENLLFLLDHKRDNWNMQRGGAWILEYRSKENNGVFPDIELWADNCPILDYKFYRPVKIKFTIIQKFRLFKRITSYKKLKQDKNADIKQCTKLLNKTISDIHKENLENIINKSEYTGTN